MKSKMLKYLMVRNILRTTNPKLRSISKKVTSVDKKLLNLIQDLEDTLEVQLDPEGVGLAAPQISVFLRVFIIKNLQKETLHFINPRITKTWKKIHPTKTNPPTGGPIMEGCLSLPHYYGPVNRAHKITLEYDEITNPPTGGPTLTSQTKTFTGFVSQAIQHELDHLEGIFFIDRLLEQHQKLYKLKGEDWQEVELI